MMIKKFSLRGSGLCRRVSEGQRALDAYRTQTPNPLDMTPTTKRLLPVAALPIAILVLLAQGCASARNSGPTVSQQGASRASAGLPASFYAALERGVVDELNRARTDPSGYARSLEQDLQYYRGNLFRRPEDESALQTREGPDALREAIGVLRSTRPMSPLRTSAGMNLGARDHVNDQAPRGLMNHRGTDGTMAWDRVSRYGEWQRKVSENMTFGPSSARDVVAGLLIDDGIRDRSHRKNVLDADIKLVGVACGPHKTYRIMCDIVHAVGFAEKK